MVPRIAQQGHSFKGAMMYYLHDKQASTTERVLWTHTHNLPTDDANKAFKWMIHTARNANYLKQQSGIAPTGRKPKTGPVYSYSLAWHPEQNPDRDIMMEAAYQTLELLGLKEHEAVFVAHNDTEHPHVHVICNLVHPETGKKAVPYNDRLVMSAWAEEQERNEGEIRCEQRVINNEIRRNGLTLTTTFDKTQERDYKKVRAIQVQHLYNQTYTTYDFVKGLDSMGYVLARGDRRGYVLVDQQGKAISLTRQLKEQKASEVNLRFKDLENVPTVKEAVHDQLHFDRDKYETERQQKIVDAAIEESAKKQEQTPQQKQQSEKSPLNKNKEQQQQEPSEQNQQLTKTSYDDSHLQALDELRAWEQKRNRQLYELEQQQQGQYQRSDLVERIQALLQSIQQRRKSKFSGLSGKLKKEQEELSALQKNLNDIDNRITEQKNALEQKLQESKPGISEELKQQRADDIKRKLADRARPDNRDIGPER